MNGKVLPIVALAVLGAALVLLAATGVVSEALAQGGDPTVDNAQRLIEEGRQTFRFDTFGDEAFWGGQLRLHEAIAGEANGGVGPGVSPNTALSVGLKVDAEALPADLVAQIQAGQVDLDDPATTLALLQLNAVVGVTGFFDDAGSLTSIGIQCALCHSTVDDSFAPGIGARLDGWANRDLNVGAIVALAPDLTPFTQLLGVDDATVRQVLNSWGPGKYDAELNLDGKAFRPDGTSAATLLPSAFGLDGINLHTYTGWGSVTYWNAYVANLQMHGQGTFYDPRLNDAEKFPLAAANGFGNVRNTPDLITPKLAALQAYQMAIPIPVPPAGSFDPEAAQRGAELFVGQAACARCHIPPLFSEPGWPLHTGEEIGIDDFQASRSPDEGYRTSPLAALWTHQKGGFYHDGRFATLPDVIQHYNSFFGLGLNEAQVSDLTQLLLSLPNDQIDWAALLAAAPAPVPTVAAVPTATVEAVATATLAPTETLPAEQTATPAPSGTATAEATAAPTATMEPNETPTVTATPEGASEAPLVIGDQQITGDGTVVASSVTVDAPAWLVIHADSSGQPGAVIGWVQVQPGTTTNVAVPIQGDKVTATLHAMLHSDLGEVGTYEFPGPDVPLTDENGQPIMVPFNVTVP